MDALPLLLLALLALSALAWAYLLRATSPQPAPEMASQVAYREGRQCCGAIYPWSGWPPDRCVYPEDHWGECER